ncbi:MAG TPA: hypothetical protein P5554_01370 [Spirochaetota bacterium]|nr:hypothetical protein [Spirochaetota bacterium]
MSVKLKIYLFIIAIFALSHVSYGKNKIAVVKSKYDNIELVLSNYNIPYDLLSLKELVEGNRFFDYDAIFFPSGIESGYEDNLEINWQGKQITSVKLSRDFFELDEKDFSQKLRSFIKSGGSAYFSGYAYKQLSSVYNCFEFFYNFPYMGIPGRIEATVLGDLAMFSLKKQAALYMEYPGWIALKSVDKAEILSEASFPTPRGEKFGPISVLIKDGDGEVIYTSYYSTVYSEFKRFNIYRIAGNKVLKRAMELALLHSQNIKARITDAFLAGETCREYYFNIDVGTNTFYFYSSGFPVMYEIYDSNNNLLVSKEVYSQEQIYTIKSTKDDYCFVKVYPGDGNRWSIYAIVAARGAVIPPYLVKSAKWIGLFFLALFVAAFLKVLFTRLWR